MLGDKDFAELPRPKFPSQLEVLDLHEGLLGLFLLFDLRKRPSSLHAVIILSFLLIKKDHLKNLIIIRYRLLIGIHLWIILKRFTPINETPLIALILGVIRSAG